jgi:ribosome-associated protein
MLTELQAERLVATELRFHSSRSGGKGGQNVNKVETQVEAELDVAASAVLSETQKHMIMVQLAQQVIRTRSNRHRSQLQNKKDAAEKLIRKIQLLLVVRKKRKSTRPSKASKEKKLKEKRALSDKKRLRKRDY